MASAYDSRDVTRSRASRHRCRRTRSMTGSWNAKCSSQKRSRPRARHWKATRTKRSTTTANGTTSRVTGASGCRPMPMAATTRSATATGSASDLAGHGSTRCPGASTHLTTAAGRTCTTGIAGAGCRRGAITGGTSRTTRGRTGGPAMMRGRETTGGIRGPMSPRAATTTSAGRARLWPSYRGASTRTGRRRTGACRIGQEVAEWYGRAEHERRSESAAADYARAAEWRDDDGAGAAGRVEQSGFVAPGDDDDDDQGVRQAADSLIIVKVDRFAAENSQGIVAAGSRSTCPLGKFHR